MRLKTGSLGSLISQALWGNTLKVDVSNKCPSRIALASIDIPVQHPLINHKLPLLSWKLPLQPSHRPPYWKLPAAASGHWSIQTQRCQPLTGSGSRGLHTRRCCQGLNLGPSACKANVVPWTYSTMQGHRTLPAESDLAPTS